MPKEVTHEDIERLSALIQQPCIVLGGAALPFYGVQRGTEDIDIEIQATSYEEVAEISERLKSEGIDGDVSGDASGWGMIPLPDGYRDRAIQTDITHIKVLHPLDFVHSKLRRGTIDDVSDCKAVCATQQISDEEIRAHLKLVKLPADPISAVYLRMIDRFCEELARPH
ncbi:MAG: DUF6036 family nucleotidyltransferase [Mariprofundaceae bacterium]